MDARSAEARPHLADWLVAAAAAVLALAVALLVLHVGRASLNVPFDYTGDANSAQMVVKDVIDHGWYQHNPDLGYPYGQDLRAYAFVSGDNLNILIVKVIGWLGAGPALAMNLFFLLTFPLCALTAYFVLRAWRVSQLASLVAAVLFAVLPYHFLHGENHVFISAYYAVPLVVWLVARAWLQQPVFTGGRLRITALVVMCLVIGSAHVYYAGFGILLILIAGIAGLLRSRDWRAAVAAVLPALVVLVAVAANHAPNVLYRHSHPGTQLFARSFSQSETYGLKLAAMALPVRDHRLPPLARLRQRYDDGVGTQNAEADPEALGTLGTLGLAGLLLGLVLVLPERRGSAPSPLLPALSLTAVAAILLGTIGGGSSLFALVVSPELRAWARISIVIGFCALAAVALALDWVARRRALSPLLACAGAAAVLVLGVLDQTTTAMTPAYSQTVAAWKSDATFVGAIETLLPPGSAVFELPYEAFPEPQNTWPGPAGASAYDGLRPYLHSSRLKWSFGDLKGHHADWQWRLVSGPSGLIPGAVASVGFTGLVLDRDSYYFPGVIEAAISAAAGPPRMVSADRRWVFWDLRRARRSAAARAATLDPLVVTWGSGFSDEKVGSSHALRLAQGQAALGVTNPDSAPRHVQLAMLVASASGHDARMVIRIQGRAVRSVRLRPDAKVALPFTAAPGTTLVTFSSDAADATIGPDIARPFSLMFEDPVVADARQVALAPALAATPPATFGTPYRQK